MGFGIKTKIASVEHAGGYKLKFTFSDGHVNVYDYEPIVMQDREEYVQYRSLDAFMKFTILEGEKEIAWGDDWDIIVPFYHIYFKSGLEKMGRKKVADKIVILRVPVRQSVIDKNGGVAECVNILKDKLS